MPDPAVPEARAHDLSDIDLTGVQLPAKIASQISGVPRWKLARMARDGELTVTFKGGHRRYSPAEMYELRAKGDDAAAVASGAPEPGDVA